MISLIISEKSLADGVEISVSNCDKPTCELKQGTTITIQIKFTPDKSIQSLVNDVSALLFNVPLPFVGVDGTNACENIYNADGSKTGCPLQPDVEYTYRNSFNVLPIYPRVSIQMSFFFFRSNEKSPEQTRLCVRSDKNKSQSTNRVNTRYAIILLDTLNGV